MRFILVGRRDTSTKIKELKSGRGTVDKTPVVGMRERSNKKVKAVKVNDTKAQTLHQIVMDNVARGSTVYTDDHGSYQELKNQGYKYETVNHSVKEYVNGIGSHEWN